MKKLTSYLAAIGVVFAVTMCAYLTADFESVLRWGPLLFALGIPLVLLFLVAVEAAPVVKTVLRGIKDDGGAPRVAAFLRHRRMFLGPILFLIALGGVNLVVTLRVLPRIDSAYKSAAIPMPWLTRCLVDGTSLLRQVPSATVAVYLLVSVCFIYWILRGDHRGGGATVG